MDCETITFEVADHVATITLDRPDALNSFNEVMATEMGGGGRLVRDTDDIHAAVLRASGERAFCPGLDLRSDVSWFVKDNPWNSFDPGVGTLQVPSQGVEAGRRGGARHGGGWRALLPQRVRHHHLLRRRHLLRSLRQRRHRRALEPAPRMLHVGCPPATCSGGR